MWTDKHPSEDRIGARVHSRASAPAEVVWPQVARLSSSKSSPPGSAKLGLSSLGGLHLLLQELWIDTLDWSGQLSSALAEECDFRGCEGGWRNDLVRRYFILDP